MEPISKPELDKSALRIPTNVKRVLRSGELGTYDVLQLMGNTVNASADEVNNATEWVNMNGEILRVNEIERAKAEGNYSASGYVNNGRIQAEQARVAAENARNAAETIRNTSEGTRIEHENTRIANEDARIAAELVREEIRLHPSYIDDDGYLCEYNINTHAYVRRDDRYMRGGIDYPSMNVLTDSMHLYALPVANGSQFKVSESGHLTFKMKTISA